jgi:hypothetical protein
VPLPVPIHSIDRWRPIDRIAKMLLRGAVHLNASDMHCFYPDLFPSPLAAAQAIHRWNGRAALIAEVKRLARQLHDPWIEVTWQPHGQGHRTRTSYVASANLAAVHAEALREFPAGLAAWTVAPFTPGAAPPPPLWVAEDADMSGKKPFSRTCQLLLRQQEGLRPGRAPPRHRTRLARLPMAERPLSAIVDFTKTARNSPAGRGAGSGALLTC